METTVVMRGASQPSLRARSRGFEKMYSTCTRKQSAAQEAERREQQASERTSERAKDWVDRVRAEAGVLSLRVQRRTHSDVRGGWGPGGQGEGKRQSYKEEAGGGRKKVREHENRGEWARVTSIGLFSTRSIMVLGRYGPSSTRSV